MIVVGLHGTRGVGKDTFYRNLSSLNSRFYRRAFADQLKADVAPLIREQFGFDPEHLTDAQKEIVRPLWIGYGMAWREKDPLHWVKVVVSDIANTPRDPALIPVITDVRFENEAAHLRESFGDGFCLVDIQREGAPPPTDEEMKHYLKVREMANYCVKWGHNTEKEEREHARAFLQWVGLESFGKTQAELDAGFAEFHAGLVRDIREVRG
jgi:hypothetical protein